MHFHLTQNNRIELSLLLRLGHSQRQAAYQLGIHPSTVSRELQRNRDRRGIYNPAIIHWHVRNRRTAANQLRLKLQGNAALATLVERKLVDNWSPQQIAGWLKKTGRSLRVCTQTIYDWVYQSARHLLVHLHCRKGKYRHTRENKLRTAGRELLKEPRRITARPAHVLLRNRFGHWEGDTVVGMGRTGYIATFVERKSGYLLAVRLQRITASLFAAAAIGSFAAIPEPYRQTLTLDNGSEMADFDDIEKQTGLQVYFAHPYHSWERGTNENTNGLLRFYFPKSMSFAHLTQEQLDQAVLEINTRPRKRLGYRTPAQVFKV